MKTGRPTFQIDASRLRAMRNEAGLTQKELARRACQDLKKSSVTAETVTKHYQKIERLGRTSKAMAEALAKALGTTVAVLQGEAPDEVPNWIDSLERQLRHQLEVGGSPALQAALEQESEATDPVRHVAVQIAAHLENAQFGQSRGELARLVELTGWTEAQLMRPVSLHGHWFLLSTENGARHSPTVVDTYDVLVRIQQSGSKYANFLESDATITMREELPWLQVEVQHPRTPTRRSTFSFVRCIPTQSGLTWVNPTWRDRFWLDVPLLYWAFTNANFVVELDGHTVPRDVRALRLLIERSSDGQTALRVAVVKGDLEELPDDILDNFHREGRSHDLVTNWIAAGLWEALAPLLGEWPADRWQVTNRIAAGLWEALAPLPGEWRADRWQVRSGACIEIGLDPSIGWSGWSGRAPDFRVKYVLRLVEEVEDGQLRPAPWRRSSAEVIANTLRRSLSEETNRNRGATAPPG